MPRGKPCIPVGAVVNTRWGQLTVKGYDSLSDIYRVGSGTKVTGTLGRAALEEAWRAQGSRSVGTAGAPSARAKGTSKGKH